MEPNRDLQAWLKHEAETQALIRDVPGTVLGGRLRRARLRMGLSIRDLAKMANVNKNSVVRMEGGGAPHVTTLLKVCVALGIHVASLAKPSGSENEVVVIHRASDDRWYDLTDFGAGPLGGLDRPLSSQERAAMVKKGTKTPLLILTSRLESGRLLPTVIELYQASEPRSHVGEEFVYVLEGTATVTVGQNSFDLGCGESATFWSAEEHVYAPASEAPLPVRVLSVRIDDRAS
ncbi:cupin domain-containing protein [Fimbriimonas ginsengisoli]|uniref:XRE family transcriptional regulator n=1 Tax=Fimbriimonas ginsengisoli Gsoil 348 TaxID=661478 RepID=A0A068NJ96_FIMGI|nr:cupin domain-containing protein [Fimbriimonas ginsengisoli]AIE83683.1 XRE family transcriptional regulator [Fimbriimonas ginsengisoli Gsoil 348]